MKKDLAGKRVVVLGQYHGLVIESVHASAGLLWKVSVTRNGTTADALYREEQLQIIGSAEEFSEI